MELFLGGMRVFICLFVMMTPAALFADSLPNIGQLKSLVAQGEYFWKFPNGNSLLNACIANNQRELSRFLISKGALENLDGGNELTHVLLETIVHDRELFYQIIDIVDRNKKLSDQVDFSEILFGASRSELPELIPIALARGGTFLELRKKYPWALEYSVSNNALEIVDILVANGFPLTDPTHTGERLLYAAVQSDGVAMLEHLISMGVEFDVDEPKTLTALGLAYFKAEMQKNPDFSMINILENHTKKKCDGNRLTGALREDSYIEHLSVVQLIAQTQNKAFLEKLNSTGCQYKILKK